MAKAPKIEAPVVTEGNEGAAKENPVATNMGPFPVEAGTESWDKGVEPQPQFVDLAKEPVEIVEIEQANSTEGASPIGLTVHKF